MRAVCVFSYWPDGPSGGEQRSVEGCRMPWRWAVLPCHLQCLEEALGSASPNTITRGEGRALRTRGSGASGEKSVFAPAAAAPWGSHEAVGKLISFFWCEVSWGRGACARSAAEIRSEGLPGLWKTWRTWSSVLSNGKRRIALTAFAPLL